MSKTGDALSEVLGIENPPAIIESSNNAVVIEPIVSNTSKDIEEDYNLSRRTFRNLIKKGENALDHLFDIAKESESPRSFEVLATMMRTIADTTKDLYDLQDKTKKLKGEDKKPDQPIMVDKAVFVGSTADLLKKVKSDENI